MSEHPTPEPRIGEHVMFDSNAPTFCRFCGMWDYVCQSDERCQCKDKEPMFSRNESKGAK